MKTFIVTKVVVYKYNLEAKNKIDALEEVKNGYDPINIHVKSETVKIVKP